MDKGHVGPSLVGGLSGTTLASTVPASENGFRLDPAAVSFRGDLLTPASNVLAGQIDHTLCKVMKDSITALIHVSWSCRIKQISLIFPVARAN